MKNILKNILKLLISGLLIAYLLRIIPLGDIVSSIKGANICLIIAAVLFFIPITLITSIQTKLLTDKQKMAMSVFDIVRIKLATGFYSLFLPGLLAGGAVKWYKFTNFSKKPEEALAIIVFNRFLELFITIVVGIIFFIPELLKGGYVRFGTALGMLFLFMLFVYFLLLKQATLEYLEKIIYASPLPLAIKKRTDQFIVSMRRFQFLKIKDHLIIMFLLLAKNMIGIFSLLLMAMSLNLPVSFWELGWVRSVVAIAVMLPVSISGFGVREGTMALLLGHYNIIPGEAVALSLLLFSKGLAGSLAGGLFELYGFFGSGNGTKEAGG